MDHRKQPPKPPQPVPVSVRKERERQKERRRVQWLIQSIRERGMGA